MSRRLQNILLNNLLWFIASLMVAIFVWFVATIEANPIEQRSFTRVDIQIEADDGMIISSTSSQTARVVVRAQQSILQILQQDDIIVRVDLRGRGPGTYTVPLNVEISRPASADTQPTQITVVLEQEVAQQIPVDISVIQPPANFTYDAPDRDIFQAEVRGAASDVSRVVEVVGELDLSTQSAEGQVDAALQLVPVDEGGAVVEGVSVTPRIINVTVNVSEREDVLELVVSPDVQFDTLPENYVFRSFYIDPETVIISGPPEILAELGDTVRTEPISLEGHTGDFSVEVPLALPEDAGIVVLDGSSTIRVDISISEQTTTLPLENIPMSVIGLAGSFSARTTPDVISVVLTGPVSLLRDITLTDVQAVIDVNGLETGTHTLAPQIIIRNGQVSLSQDDITLLPSTVSIVISTPVPEETGEATSEASGE